MIYLIFFFLTIVCHADDFRIKIAVIDTGIKYSSDITPYLCNEEHKDFTSTSIIDNNGHGTAVSKLIIRNLDPSKHCLLILKWINTTSKASNHNIELALFYSYLLGVQYINMSLSGEDSYSDMEYKVIGLLLKSGTKIVVAAGNNNKDLSKNCNIFPACYNYNKNFYVVANYNKEDKIGKSNYNGPVNSKQYGKYLDHLGTSYSTAIQTGLLVKENNK